MKIKGDDLPQLGDYSMNISSSAEPQPFDMEKRNWTTWLPEQYGYGRMKVWTSPLFKIETKDV